MQYLIIDVVVCDHIQHIVVRETSFYSDACIVQPLAVYVASKQGLFWMMYMISLYTFNMLIGHKIHD